MKKKQPPKRRNIIANDPLMRKGGVHEKTGKAKRKRFKDNFKKQIDSDIGDI